MTVLTPVSFKQGRASAPRLSPPRVPGKHSARFWTAEEDAIIRRLYPAGGATACVLELSKIGSAKAHTRSVYLRASTLRVRFEGQNGGRKVRVRVDDAGIDDKIQAGWPMLAGRGAVTRFADELGVPRSFLTDRAIRLGLTMPHRKEPPWTAAEEALMSRVPLHNPDRASAVFREHGFCRTPTSIVIRAKRLGISRRRKDVFSGTSAAKVLGVDTKTFSSWCIAGHVKAERRGTSRLPQQGGDVWSITPENLRRFVLDNLERIDIRKVEKFAFVDLLTRVLAASQETLSSSPAEAGRA